MPLRIFSPFAIVEAVGTKSLVFVPLDHCFRELQETPPIRVRRQII